MHDSEDPESLSVALRDRVLERLGFSMPPSPDLEGLRALYGAWCRHVPFDNVRKMTALRGAAARPLPGARATDFFEHWLGSGAGGTCWPGSNALFELVHAAGFLARRVIASMRDTGVANHASVKVRIDGTDWLVDSSMLTNAPLPLAGEPMLQRDPVFPAEVEPVDGSHVIWWHSPPTPGLLPCRLLVDPATYGQYVAGYEASRDRSPFNQRLYARCNRPGKLLILAGRTRLVKTAGGIQSRDLSADELRRELSASIGLSEELIDQWAGCGGLEASLEAESGPVPPPVTRKPPSQR